MHKASLVLAAAPTSASWARTPPWCARPSRSSRLRGAHRRGQVRITRRVFEHAARERGVGRRHPPPHALPRPLTRSASSATRASTDLDRPVHHRGARGVRAPRRGSALSLCRGRLRGHPARGREGGRRHRVGRRQQRLAVLRSDLEIVALDPHRPGHERAYFPGEVNFLRADVLVINKVNTAEPEGIDGGAPQRSASYNPGAVVVDAARRSSWSGRAHPRQARPRPSRTARR